MAVQFRPIVRPDCAGRPNRVIAVWIPKLCQTAKSYCNLGDFIIREPTVIQPVFRWLTLVLMAVVLVPPQRSESAEPELRDDALRVMKSAAAFYRQKVASHGGYVYLYSEDLKQRWGEGKADAETIIVQPPGTPAVGMAYLKAHAATGDKFYLEAARETAEALVYGQLKSGGWAQTIHFGPAEQKGERRGKYRNGKGGDWDRSSLDDGQTQAALKMLLLTDQALEFKHAAIHEAAQYGLNAMLKAQFANGAFPQVWAGPATSQPVVKAKFPDYGWKQKARFDKIEKSLQQAQAGTVTTKPNRSIKSLTDGVSKISSDLDAQGRWVNTYAGEPLVGQPKLSPSFRYISSDVFRRNIETLSEYVEFVKK